MPTVTITLIDTPTGGVAIKTDFSPAVGEPCSAAQSAALDIINRTRHAYGLQEPERVSPGVDIDAAHALTPHVVAVAKRLHHANPAMTLNQCVAYAKAEMARI